MRAVRLCTLISLATLTVASHAEPLDEGQSGQAVWTEVAPGGATICGRGAPFSFFVRDGDPQHVIVDFIGGGACWDGRSCAPGTATFTDNVDSVRRTLSEPLTGVYNPENPENPYRNWTHVLVPYCTGDLHWGNAVKTYTSNSGQEFTIHHKGAVNAAAVLDWVKSAYARPQRVHVNGCSAGSYGSIFWTPYIQEQYRYATVTQFGDAGAGVLTPGFMNIGLSQWNFAPAAPRWVPGLDPRDTDYGRLPLDEFYVRIARHYPDTRLAQFNTSFDFVQTFFYLRIGGRQDDWNPAMRHSISQIKSKVANFSSFIAPGDTHCGSVEDDLYDIESDGVHLSDWLSQYVDLQAVPHVDCGDDCQ